ncbi:MAG: Replication initiator protein A [Rhodoferax sp.]|nr:Replication initiator protein A [Rhodoferax sp.]
MRPKRTFEENLALAKARGQPAGSLQARFAHLPGDLQLPLWAEVCRGVPNSILRSALFGLVRHGQRSFQQRVEKASVDGIKIIHTGPQLDQADLDVWEQALQLARTGGLGCRIQFTASQFLKSIGRSSGKSQHEWLKGAFARLAASVVEIKDGRRTYFGSLLSHGGRDDQTGRYVIEMNPKIVELYGLDGWSSVEFGQRMALKRRPLAQWLHGYYSSHARPFPVKVVTLQRLCGSHNHALKGFRQDLREALDRLVDVTHWTWEIDVSDLVHLSKLPTASQSRHLLKRKRSGESH